MRLSLFLPVMFSVGAVPLFGQGVVCTLNAGTPPFVRSSGFSELLGDIVANCQGGTPTPNGGMIPQYDISITLNGPVSSRLLTAGGMLEALLVVDEPNSPAWPNRPLLNCGSPNAPDDDAGNNGPTGTNPGVCGIRSTGNPRESYDGTAGTAGIWSTGRPNVFQGRSNGFNGILFKGVPIDPPGTTTTRAFRFVNIRASAASFVIPLPGQAIAFSISIAGLQVLFNQQQQIVGFLAPATNSSDNTIDGVGGNVVRVPEGFASSFKPRNFASYYRNAASAANGGDFGVDIATLFDQNVPGAIYLSEEALSSLGRGTPPGGNPNGNPPMIFQPAPGNAVAGGTFAGSASLNIAQSGLATQGSRIALRFENLVNGYSVKVPRSLRLVRAATGAASGIAQLVTGTTPAGAGGTVATDRDTTSLVELTGAPNPVLAVYEILYTDPFALENLVVPVTLVRNAAAGENPLTTPRVSVGMAPFFASGASVSQLDAQYPTPRFNLPPESLALNLGPLGFETTAAGDGVAGSFYQTRFVGRGGTPPYSFTVASGSLPPGLTLDSAAGVLNGTPTLGGTYTFALSMSDNALSSVQQSFTLPIIDLLISPPNGVTAQSTRVRLEWTNTGGAVSLVYFGTTPDPPFVASTNASFYDPPGLSPNTTYYWKIQVQFPGNLVTSLVYSFTTLDGCPSELLPSARKFSHLANPFTVSVAAQAGCNWTASTNAASWMTLNSPAGSGAGSFPGSLAANNGLARAGTITSGGRSVKIMQAGFPEAVFGDVPPAANDFDYISLLYASNITAGCSLNPFLYCPDTPVTRAQMSVFMVAALNQALGTTLVYTPTPHFNDMPEANIYFRFVQRIRDLGITAGCSVNPPLFCPDASITHGQMAVFMIASWMQANNLTTFTYPTTPYFSDVPPNHPFFRFIQKVRELGIRNGCGGTLYCEGSPVTRAEMAPMILRAILAVP